MEWSHHQICVWVKTLVGHLKFKCQSHLGIWNLSILQVPNVERYSSNITLIGLLWSVIRVIRANNLPLQTNKYIDVEFTILHLRSHLQTGHFPHLCESTQAASLSHVEQNTRPLDSSLPPTSSKSPIFVRPEQWLIQARPCDSAARPDATPLGCAVGQGTVLVA